MKKSFYRRRRSRRWSARRSLRRVSLTRHASPVGAYPHSRFNDPRALEPMLRLHLRTPAERGDERRYESHPQRAAEPENEHLPDSQADSRSARAVVRVGQRVERWRLGRRVPSRFRSAQRSGLVRRLVPPIRCPRRGVAHLRPLRDRGRRFGRSAVSARYASRGLGILPVGRAERVTGACDVNDALYSAPRDCSKRAADHRRHRARRATASAKSTLMRL